MNKNPEVTESNRTGKGKSVLKILLFLVIGLLVLMIGFYTGGMFAQPSSEGTCTPLPQDGAFAPAQSGIYTIEGQDEKVFILRGIIEKKAEPSTTDSVDELPPCYSSEKGMYTLKGYTLIAENGDKVFLVKGVGSSRGFVVEPTPFP